MNYLRGLIQNNPPAVIGVGGGSISSCALRPLLRSSLVPFPGSSPPARQVGASLAPAGRTGRPRWPARAGQARPAGRARLGLLWSPKWDRWTPNHEFVMQFWSKSVGHV